MNLQQSDIRDAALLTGFDQDPLEKLVRLIGLLNSFEQNPYTKTRFVLKGGTALNLFIFDLPRLSLDIDFNYIGSPDRETMLQEKEEIHRTIRAICLREGYTLKREPTGYAGGKWRLGFDNLQGRSSRIDIDVGFTSRVPLWQVQTLNSLAVGSFLAQHIPVLDVHELAAGKLRALFTRGLGRDLFDTYTLLTEQTFEVDKLRLAFVVYVATSREDWKEIAIDNIRCDHQEFRQQLLPLLRRDVAANTRFANELPNRLESHCRELVSIVLPFTTNEQEFLKGVSEQGEINAEILTDDEQLVKRIKQQPHLLWKIQNVRNREKSIR